MILKGSQRSGGQELAAHLLRTDENEQVDLYELRGFADDDLHGAFKEAQAIARGTKCRQYLFSLSLNPPETENVPVEAFEAAIDQIEGKLGLKDQPRAIVFHEKEGRRHAHCVWSRIDAETMTAKRMSFFKTKLTEVSRELYLEHDWKMPNGLADPSKRDPRNFTLAEWQQAKRAGHDPRVFKQAIQDAWAVSDSKAAFEHALNERGLWLAKGDRRGHVIIDHQGEVYGLARTLGKRAKEVRARIGREDDLPSASDVKQRIALEMSPVLRKHLDEARASWRDLSATLAFKKAAIRDRQREERRKLVERQEARRTQETKARAEKLPKGIKGLWARVTGKLSKLKDANEREAQKCVHRDKLERQDVVFRHLNERRKFQKQVRIHRSKQAETLVGLRTDRHRIERLKHMIEPRRSKPPRLKRSFFE